jgi:O-antigen/teichoic acid export membrane protein
MEPERDQEAISAARLDRELNELLQELRAEQNGILLLVGFLLVIPFSARFKGVSQFEKDAYLFTLMMAGTASLVIIAPVAYHRMVFRRYQKAKLVERGHVMALTALVLLSLTILGVLVLVTNFLFPTWLVVLMSVVYVVVVTLLWWVLPLESRRREAAAEPESRQAFDLTAIVPK